MLRCEFHFVCLQSESTGASIYKYTYSGLGRIGKWIDGTEDSNASVMWVKGGAGIEKSTIAKTMAHRLEDEKRLLASFFFSRMDSSRNSAHHLIPTIAYQAALRIPQLKGGIIQAVEQDPLIFKLSPEAQFSSLLTEPIRDLAEAGHFNSPSCPCVVVIDGLDECENPSAQVSILHAVSNALRTSHFPLLFLITSHPEQHLSMAFTSGPIHEFHTCLALEDPYFLDHDTRFFLKDRFEELKRWLLRCFLRLLDRSSSSKELLEIFSQCFFTARFQDWPRLARDAINRYIPYFQGADAAV
ncbi:hypothetical protein BDZ97DRAFT_1810102 [Flammula alnicola]|nr:hypothetical protein BDZ97DRAFT_1810102 [Flammula alnicola]